MTGEEAVQALVALAAAVGVEVRIEPFGSKLTAGKGGLCRIRGRRVVLVDATLSPLEQAGIIGEALARVSFGSVAVPDALAPFLKSGHAKVKPLVRPRPLARGRRG